MLRKLAFVGAIALAGVGIAGMPSQAAPRDALSVIVNEATTLSSSNYVELQATSNINNQTGSLQGWSLRVFSSTGAQTAIFTFTTQRFTRPAQHMLIAAPGANTGGVTPDVIFNGLDIESTGGVAVYDPNGVKQDGVAFSSNPALFAAAGEGTSATDSATAESPEPGLLRSVSRNNGSPTSADVNNNRLDFSVQHGTPMNRAS